MKVVLLAGGFGTRISEESQFKPKPMVELGGMPILWHIMKLYSAHGCGLCINIRSIYGSPIFSSDSSIDLAVAS